MTAVISSGTSPFSVLDEDEEMQSWQLIEEFNRIEASSAQNADLGSFDDAGTGEMLFNSSAVTASPSIVSQGSWNIVGFTGGHQQQQHNHHHHHHHHHQHQQQQPSQERMGSFTTPSPVLSNHMNDVHTASYSAAAAFGVVSAADVASNHGALVFDFGGAPPLDMSHQAPRQQQPFLDHTSIEGQGEAALLTQNLYNPQSVLMPGFDADFDAGPMLAESIFNSYSLPPGFGTQPLPDIPLSMQDDVMSVQPWVPRPVQNPLDSEHFMTPGSDGDSISLSPVMGQAQNSGEPIEAQAVAVHAIPKKSSGVQKPKRKNKTPPRTKSPDRRLEDGVFKFCNQTVDTFGKASFGEMEHLDRSSQKGRKGALSDEVRASALNVRKQGACFCCHVRKVKCDEQRPCKNCVKLCTQVPEVACWKFPEFTTILFPAFLRHHFERAEMARFVEDNVASFTVNGVERACTVALSSGELFATKLTVRAKFFTPTTPASEVMRHWYNVHGYHGVELETVRSVPIGLDIMDSDTGGSLRAELKRKIMAYMEGLTQEETYVYQLNDLIRNTTQVPTLVLELVQKYAQAAPEADATIVRRVLGILVLQHVMTRHLTLTPQSIADLQRTCLLPFKGPFVTSRLLARQIKVVVDECTRDLVPMLFDDFLKRLKSKSRKEWAPCVAAFLVFCLLMEVTEAAADNFAIAETEIEMRKRKPAKFMRAQALEANRQIENMPFKQFAYQFHQIYQTHTQDAAAKSFNPLHENSRSDMWDLEPAAMEFVRGLREGIDVGELDWLTFDPILPPSGEAEMHPYPRDVGGPYMGRLVAKFLLSFNDIGALFTAS